MVQSGVLGETRGGLEGGGQAEGVSMCVSPMCWDRGATATEPRSEEDEAGSHREARFLQGKLRVRHKGDSSHSDGMRSSARPELRQEQLQPLGHMTQK